MAFVQLIQLWAMFYKENEVGGKFDPMEDHSTRGSYYGDTRKWHSPLHSIFLEDWHISSWCWMVLPWYGIVDKCDSVFLLLSHRKSSRSPIDYSSRYNGHRSCKLYIETAMDVEKTFHVGKTVVLLRIKCLPANAVIHIRSNTAILNSFGRWKTWGSINETEMKLRSMIPLWSWSIISLISFTLCKSLVNTLGRSTQLIHSADMGKSEKKEKRLQERTAYLYCSLWNTLRAWSLP